MTLGHDILKTIIRGDSKEVLFIRVLTIIKDFQPELQQIPLQVSFQISIHV